MPVQRCRADGKAGWRWGKSGKCYIGSAAKSKAVKQGQAVRASGWTENVRKIRTTIARTNALKADPTRTKTLRKKFERALGRKFALLQRALIALVVEEDAFGLKKPGPFNQEQDNEQNDEPNRRANTERENKRQGFCSVQGRNANKLVDRIQVGTRNGCSVGNDDGLPSDVALLFMGQSSVGNQRFAFRSTREQLALFEEWLQERFGTLVTDERDAYWEQFIREGYEKGAGRAFDDTHKARRAAAIGSNEQLAFYEGTKEQFLVDAFGQTESLEKVQLLASRTLTDLKNVNTDLAAKLNRVLVDGLTQGQNPRVIAKTMSDSLGISKRRAQTIARTEIIRAHAEGQLDAMERMGVERVGVMVEWSSAGDDRVCPLCISLDGVVLRLSEARGLIPRHPNCRCAHVPAQVGEPRETARRVNYGDGPIKLGQKRSKGDIQAAIKRSIDRERKKGTLKEKIKKSPWPGADKVDRIAKTRPKSPLYPAAKRPKEDDPKIQGE